MHHQASSSLQCDQGQAGKRAGTQGGLNLPPQGVGCNALPMTAQHPNTPKVVASRASSHPSVPKSKVAEIRDGWVCQCGGGSANVGHR